jgi:hypothetical protein
MGERVGRSCWIRPCRRRCNCTVREEGGRPVGSGAVKKRKLADQGPLPRPAAAFPKRRDDDWDRRATARCLASRIINHPAPVSSCSAAELPMPHGPTMGVVASSLLLCWPSAAAGRASLSFVSVECWYVLQLTRTIGRLAHGMAMAHFYFYFYILKTSTKLRSRLSTSR